MAAAGVARQVRVVPSEDGEVHVPIDVASLLGADAELEVAPGMTVTLRPWTLGAQPVVETAKTRPSQPRAILEVRNLSVAYGATKAVDDITFQVVHGEIFGLLGPNGAGKTSTLSAIEGLIRPARRVGRTRRLRRPASSRRGKGAHGCTAPGDQFPV